MFREIRRLPTERLHSVLQTDRVDAGSGKIGVTDRQEHTVSGPKTLLN